MTTASSITEALYRIFVLRSQPGMLARTHGEQPGLPRGRASLPRAAVRANHRYRLLRAITAAVAEKGYARVTITDVVCRARISRNAFYEQFADKEAAFVAANDWGSGLMFERIAQRTRALPPAARASERLATAIRAYLEFLAQEPEFARTFLIDVFAAGPTALERFRAAHRRFVANTRRWYARARREDASLPPLPDDVFIALVGAIHELAATYVRERRTAELPRLERTALRLHLATIAGWDAAPVRQPSSTGSDGQ